MSGIFRFLGGLTVLATVLVMLVGGLGIVQAIDDLTGAPTVHSAPTVAREGQALNLTGARADSLTFYLADNAIDGLWAAPRGLRLDLADESGDFEASTQVVAPKQKDWTDPVFFFSTPANRGAGNRFEIQGSYTVPDVPGPETQTLTGSLEGEFLYPGETDDGEHFTTTTVDLDIPATLEVVSAAESERRSSDFRGARHRRIVVGIVYLVLGFSYAISYGMWKDGDQTRSWEPYLTLMLGLSVWACFGALWLQPFGA